MSSSSSKLDSMLFFDFCTALAKIRGNGSLIFIKSKMAKFFDECRKKCASEESFNEEIKPFLSLLLSSSNEDRKLNIGQKKLTDFVSKVAMIRELQSSKMKAESVVAAQLAEAVASRFDVDKGEMTVREICDCLDNIATADGQSIKENELQTIINKCTELELVYIFNIMMRNLESYIGLSRSQILGCLSKDANAHWTRTRDLDRLTSRPSNISEPDYFLGVNFCPQLLARLSKDAIDDQVASNLRGGFFMEVKYDGEHVLLHKMGERYRWFTRNGKEFTDQYGSTSTDKLSGRIHPFFKDTVTECILDCELMHYDENAMKFVRHLEKGSDGVVLSYKAPQAGHRIVVVVFDMLYFGGTIKGQEFREDLMCVKLEDRVEIMRDRLLKLKNKKELEKNIFIAPREAGTTGDDIRNFFQKAMEKGEEGIAIKRKDSLYRLGERAMRNGWFKLKDVFDMDLVIVGYVPAKDAKGASLLLAAWDEESSPPSYLHVICKSYSGLQEMDWKNLLSHAHRNGPLLERPPEGLLHWTKNKTIEYFRKEDWVVVEAKAFGVKEDQLTDVTMKLIRNDKTVCKEDVADFRELKRHKPGEDPYHHDSSKNVVKNKRVTQKDIFAEAASPLKKRRESDDVIECELTDKTVAVLQSFDTKLRRKCMDILQRFGAKCVANYTPDCVLLIAPSPNHVMAKSAVKKANATILKADWLLRCQEKESLVQWSPEEVVLEVADGFKLAPTE